MITMLRKFGVEPQAIKQPLNLTIPENKMTLAIYLTAPEIENDRRSLNVVYAIRRQKRRGGLMSCPRCDRAICGSSSKGRGATCLQILNIVFPK